MSFFVFFVFFPVVRANGPTVSQLHVPTAHYMASVNPHVKDVCIVGSVVGGVTGTVGTVTGGVAGTVGGVTGGVAGTVGGPPCTRTADAVALS